MKPKLLPTHAEPFAGHLAKFDRDKGPILLFVHETIFHGEKKKKKRDRWIKGFR